MNINCGICGLPTYGKLPQHLQRNHKLSKADAKEKSNKMREKFFEKPQEYKHITQTFLKRKLGDFYEVTDCRKKGIKVIIFLNCSINCSNYVNF